MVSWPALISTGPLAWQARRRALRELKHMQLLEEWTLALDDGNLVNRAKVVLATGDSIAALHLWQKAVQQYPRFTRRSRDSLEILLGLQRLDEAEALMLEGQRREPGDPFYAEGRALVSEHRGDLYQPP
jgi:hypothetical protein